jgi:CDP-paratose 2-epimerase
VRILVTGACGFVGSTLLHAWVERGASHRFWGIDNLSRPGSEGNRLVLRGLGISVRHADLRCASDFENLPPVDAVVDAAANPSVLAGIDGQTSSRQVVEHNLFGTVNILEYCRRLEAAFVLLSTSRVYSIPPLAGLPVRERNGAFEPDPAGPLPRGLSSSGVSESFSTAPPISLYGSTKLASEQLAQEYGQTFGFRVFVNRCGVMAGAGQFGRADQGIFSYWINRWLRRKPLRYIGFGGRGFQVRDCLHPADLIPLLEKQLGAAGAAEPAVLNLSGGATSAMSLRQLSDWCHDRLGAHEVISSTESRPFDVPWMVLDPSLAASAWGWAPTRSREEILEEILDHAGRHPNWLEVSEAD